jgi:phosphonate transport system permease protein
VAWPQLVIYTRYRLECGIRSSSVLGFVGLPTLGFHLETYFKQGDYSQAAGVLYLFFMIIASLRQWTHRRGLFLLLLASVIWLPFELTTRPDIIVRFLTHDILPQPMRDAASVMSVSAWSDTYYWCVKLVQSQAGVGVWNTLLLTMISLVGSGIVTLLLYPLVSPLFFRKRQQLPGHLFLVVLRSIPELMLAFVVVVMVGPSMLPAIIALSLHNGAIIAHLIGHSTSTLKLRLGSAQGLNRYFYEVTPRIYRPFLAFLFYRWEVILRESAILGILGIHTLGFYVDSAFEELRFDRALFLILITALLNILVDIASRRIRNQLRLTALPEIR